MDPKLFGLIDQEKKRQAETLSLIASENYVSPGVRQALGSTLTNKYSEGYPGKRYYQGNKIVDEIEKLAIERAKKLFGVPHANVQPYSGSPANLAILAALCRVGEPILSQSLAMGGHLSMGQSASMTSKFYKAFYYGLTQEGEINWQELGRQAEKCQPRVVFCGGTAFTKILDFKRFAQVAAKVKAFLVADISHVAGLVVGKVHPSPVDFADVVMTTTHKTLRGPRGAIIMVTQKGLQRDCGLGEKIDQAVFPGLQGGPHDNNMAGMAVALAEAAAPAFKKYAQQVVKNCRVLAEELIKHGFKLVGGGTENHMIWLDLSQKKYDGWVAAWALEAAGIIANRQTVPFDSRPPYYPSGLRLGTPAMTTRGMKEKEMMMIGNWIKKIFDQLEKMDLSGIGDFEKKKDQEARKNFKKAIFQQKELLEVRKQIAHLCRRFPAP